MSEANIGLETLVHSEKFKALRDQLVALLQEGGFTKKDAVSYFISEAYQALLSESRTGDDWFAAMSFIARSVVTTCHLNVMGVDNESDC